MSLRTIIDKLWLMLFWLSGLLVLAVLLAIIAFLVVKGGPAISWEFLTASPKGLFLGVEGGIWPAIKGTAALVLIAVISSAFPALFTALYLAEYAGGSKLSYIIMLATQCMIGIPSILTGLFGYALFVVYLGFGTSLLAGGLTLGIMVYPTLVVLMRNALNEVSDDYRIAGLALGVSRWYIIRRIILPKAAPGLISAVLLAMGYAAGATAPIMVTATVIIAKGSLALFDPVMALPYHLYIMFSQHVSLENAYGTALVLVFMLIVINTVALCLQRRRKETS
ncbi:MAG: phosphate ABC transporter permease PstA [Veillonellaceae bacterium]|jgi:phosphate transport system permease protein|nr:phosphate ABC transporter permease PstA [Veillonellaceae bacterium]